MTEDYANCPGCGSPSVRHEYDYDHWECDSCKQASQPFHESHQCLRRQLAQAVALVRECQYNPYSTAIRFCASCRATQVQELKGGRWVGECVPGCRVAALLAKWPVKEEEEDAPAESGLDNGAGVW